MYIIKTAADPIIKIASLPFYSEIANCKWIHFYVYNKIVYSTNTSNLHN